MTENDEGKFQKQSNMTENNKGKPQKRSGLTISDFPTLLT